MPVSHPESQTWRARGASLGFTAPHVPTTAAACRSLSSQTLPPFSQHSQGQTCLEVSEVCLICKIMYALFNYSVCLALNGGSVQCFSSAKSQMAPSCCQAKFPDSPPRHPMWGFCFSALAHSLGQWGRPLVENLRASACLSPKVAVADLHASSSRGVRASVLLTQPLTYPTSNNPDSLYKERHLSSIVG